MVYKTVARNPRITADSKTVRLQY